MGYSRLQTGGDLEYLPIPLWRRRKRTGGGGGSILPLSMMANPPDIYLNLKTNQAQYKSGAVTAANLLTTVSRASAATQVDSSGNWFQFPANTLARTDLGASIWEARTNSIRNSTMTGAVVMADGVELTTNGTFVGGSGTTTAGVGNAVCSGWTVNTTTGTSSISFSGSSVTLTGDGSTTNTWISQKISGFIVGRSYVVAIFGGSGIVNAYVGNFAGDNSTAATNVQGNGQNASVPDRTAFTATSTSHWVSLEKGSASPATVGSISVQDGERVQNGGFTSSPINAAQSTVQNGWLWFRAAGVGTVTYVPGTPNKVQIVGDGNQIGIDATIPTVAGFTYTLSVDIGVNTVTVNAGTTAFGTTLLNINGGPGAGLKYQFTATGTTTHISFTNWVATTATIANVSVQSAGTLPTNWSIFAANGVTTSVAAVGTQNGINTIDLQFGGTANNTFYVLSWDTAPATASAGQTWSSSAFFAYVGAPLTNVSAYNIEVRQVGGSAPNFDQAFTPTSTLTRATSNATLGTGATGAYGSIFMTITNGAAISGTLRIGWPQLELNSSINSTVASAVMAASGAGGVNGSAVYSVGGGAGPTTATLNVTWTAGVMAVNSVANAGSYTTFPPSPAALTYVSGTATGWTGATVTLTPTDNHTLAAASNPILTTSAAVTRNAEADTLVLTGLPAFGSAYTLWARGTPQTPVGYSIIQNLLQADSGASANRFSVRRDSGDGLPRILLSTGGSANDNAVMGGVSAWAQNASAKLAFAAAAADQRAAYNGTLDSNSYSSTMPIGVNAVGLGNNSYDTSFALNGNLEEIAIWFTQRVPNATLQAMTT